VRSGQNEQAVEILASIFHRLDPKKVAESDAPLHVVLGNRLGKAAELLGGGAIGDPLGGGRMQMILGSSLYGLGHAKEAIQLHEKARRTLEALVGPDDPRTLSNANQLALVLSADGQSDKALPLFERTLEKRRAVLGPNHRDTLQSMNNLAVA